MTISSTSSRVVLSGDGTNTTWQFPFKVQQPADLAVIYTDAAGNDVTLSSSQYAATGFGVDSGGTVTYPLSGSAIARGATMTIYRNVAVTQPTSISNQGAMWPQVIEAALDRLTCIGQAVTDAISRSLVISPTDGGVALGTLPNAAQRKNSLLGFDANGQPYAAQAFSSTSTASTWAAANLLTATSAAAPRAALAAAGIADDNSFTGTNRFTTQAAADNSTKAATTAYVDRAAVLRSYLAGLGLSTAGASASFSVGAGMATDSGNTSTMTLASSITKTTAAWAAGGGNGALDTGAIANGTWYHVHLIKRTDTGAVDVLISLSATSPTLPAAYTLSRRIGSMQTDGSARWKKFMQDGDFFFWPGPVADIADTNPGTSLVTRTLTVPPGVNVMARVIISCVFASISANLYAHDLSMNDDAAVWGFGFGDGTSAPGGQTAGWQGDIRTNTSGQIGYRLSASGASDVVNIRTIGWFDRRGRDS